MQARMHACVCRLGRVCECVRVFVPVPVPSGPSQRKGQGICRSVEYVVGTNTVGQGPVVKRLVVTAVLLNPPCAVPYRIVP